MDEYSIDEVLTEILGESPEETKRKEAIKQAFQNASPLGGNVGRNAGHAKTADITPAETLNAYVADGSQNSQKAVKNFLDSSGNISEKAENDGKVAANQTAETFAPFENAKINEDVLEPEQAFQNASPLGGNVGRNAGHAKTADITPAETLNAYVADVSQNSQKAVKNFLDSSGNISEKAENDGKVAANQTAETFAPFENAKINEDVLEPEIASTGGLNDIKKTNKNDVSKTKKSIARENKKVAVKKVRKAENVSEIMTEYIIRREGILFRVIFLIVIAAVESYLTFAPVLRMPILSVLTESSPQSYLLVQGFLGLITLVIGLDILRKGIFNFIVCKATSESFVSLAALAGMVPLIIGAINPRCIGGVVIFTPSAAIAFLFAFIGRSVRCKSAVSNADFLNRNVDKYVLNCIDGERAETLARGTTGQYPVIAAQKKARHFCDIRKNIESLDMADNFSRVAAPTALVLSAVVSYALFKYKFPDDYPFEIDGLAQIFSWVAMLMTISAGFALPICVKLRLQKAVKKINKTSAEKSEINSFGGSSGAFLGYNSAYEFYDVNSVLIDAKMLFPDDSVIITGIKIMPEIKREVALACMTAMAQAAGSVLTGELKLSLESFLKTDWEKAAITVDDFSYEGGLGFSGKIRDKRILFGTRDLMLAHNVINLPPFLEISDYVKNTDDDVFYLAVSGKFSAIAGVKLTVSQEILNGVTALAKKQICFIVRAVDHNISVKGLSKLFKIDEELIKIIPQSQVKDYFRETAPKDTLPASIITVGRVSSVAAALLAARSVIKMAFFTLWLQISASVLGFALCVFFIVNGQSVNSLSVIGYSTLCAALILILSSAFDN